MSTTWENPGRELGKKTCYMMKDWKMYVLGYRKSNWPDARVKN